MMLTTELAQPHGYGYHGSTTTQMMVNAHQRMRHMQRTADTMQSRMVHHVRATRRFYGLRSHAPQLLLNAHCMQSSIGKPANKLWTSTIPIASKLSTKSMSWRHQRMIAALSSMALPVQPMRRRHHPCRRAMAA